MGRPLEVSIPLDTVKSDNYKKRSGPLEVIIALDTAKHYNYKLPRQHEGSIALDRTRDNYKHPRLLEVGITLYIKKCYNYKHNLLLATIAGTTTVWNFVTFTFKIHYVK